MSDSANLRGFIPPAILLIAFAALAVAMGCGALEGPDERLMLALRTDDVHDPLGPPALERLGVAITHLGDYWTITTVTGAVIVFLLLWRRQASALLIFSAVAGGALLNEVLKALFERARPDLIAHIVEVNSLSFPSGHAMSAATLYLTLGALLARTRKSPALRGTIVATAIVITCAVGISRVYLGVHWPSDVLGGWLAGGAWALLCWEIARRLQKRGAIEKPD